MITIEVWTVSDKIDLRKYSATFLALDELMSTHVSAAFIQNTPTVRATLKVQKSEYDGIW